MSITTILPSQISELSVEDDDSDVDDKAIEEQKIYLCSLSSSRLVHILVNRFLCCLRSVTNLHRCLSNSSLRFLHGSPNNGEHVMMLSVPRPPFLNMELFLVGLDAARHGPENIQTSEGLFFHCHDLE